MASHAWLLALNSSSATVFGSRVIDIIVWIGAAAILVTLLTLARTRWGQSQPLSKCVVLSVFAHLLLFLYASGTTIMCAGPSRVGTDTIPLALIGSDASSPTAGAAPAEGGPSSSQAETVAEPWEELPEGESVEPPDARAERLAVETSEVARATPAALWTQDSPLLPQPEMPETDPMRPPVALPPMAMLLAQTPVQPMAIDEAVPPPRPLPPVTIPEPIAPQRIDTSPPVPLTPDREREAQLPGTVMEVGSQVQQLADVAAQAEPADARAGRDDQVAESENRDVDGREHSGSVTPPTPSGLVALPPRNHPVTVLAAAAPTLIEQAVTRATPRLGDGQPLPEPYRLRMLAAQNEVAPALGGSATATSAVDAALAWLSTSQESDGSWDSSRWGGGVELKVAGHDREGAGADADTGITGLAILAFLGNGQTHLEGTYRKNVQRGLEFLLRSQGADGNLSGPARLYARMYCHGIATLALSEALALTGDMRLRPAVARAIQFTVDAQHPTTGGWRYQPGDVGDMSQFGWQVMAIKSASLGGITVPQRTREGMLHFLQRCEMGSHGGLSCYRPGTPATRSMTAEALVSRYFLDLAPDRQLVTEASDYLLGEKPEPGVPNLYYWYYGTLALFQVQGDAWTQWNSALQQHLLPLQRADGALAGSWDPDTVWGCYGGRVYTTAMASLCLEVYYRYLPLTALRGGDRGRR
jgi:hypothetical protein